MITLLFWGAIALTVYKGCDALSKQAHNPPSGESGGTVEPRRPGGFGSQRDLVTASRLGPIRLGISRRAVEERVGSPTRVEHWRKHRYYQGSRDIRTPSYHRLIYNAGTRQTNVFICTKTGQVSTVWSNDPRYRSVDGFGVNSLEEDFRNTYPYRFGEVNSPGYYDREYYYRRFSASPGLKGRCESTSPYTRISYGIFNFRLERIDSIAVGWSDDPPLTLLGRDSYTPIERGEFGELSP